MQLNISTFHFLVKYVSVIRMNEGCNISRNIFANYTYSSETHFYHSYYWNYQSQVFVRACGFKYNNNVNKTVLRRTELSLGLMNWTRETKRM
jgi:hypothetical protein